MTVILLSLQITFLYALSEQSVNTIL